MYNAPLVLLLDITVNNNDVLRRLRYTFNFNDKQMAVVFASAGENFTREQISQWLKKDNDADFVAINDTQLAIFLNGFINDKRGKKPGEQVAPEKKLTNNIILTKLKIALNLKAEELIELLNTVDFRLSKPELSAFSRKSDHKHYRECKDQVLRNLLQAIDKKYHVARTKKIIKSDENRTPLNHRKTHQGEQKSKNIKKSEPFVEGARPNASVIYENPKNKVKPKRNQLKLSK